MATTASAEHSRIWLSGYVSAASSSRSPWSNGRIAPSGQRGQLQQHRAGRVNARQEWPIKSCSIVFPANWDEGARLALDSAEDLRGCADQSRRWQLRPRHGRRDSDAEGPASAFQQRGSSAFGPDFPSCRVRASSSGTLPRGTGPGGVLSRLGTTGARPHSRLPKANGTHQSTATVEDECTLSRALSHRIATARDG